MINSDLNAPRASTSFKRLVLSFFFLLTMAGCGGEKPAPVLMSMTAAQKKFEQKCREDFDLHVITRMAGSTLWIYLPVKDPIFDYEAQKENSGEAHKKPSKFTVQYLDGNFKDGNFFFEYDIVTRKKVKAEDYGYSSSYTDNYVKAQNNLFTAISDVFFNAKPKAGEADVKFVVIVITDIKKGIETKATLSLEDFKRYMSGDLPYEEYMKRFLADTKGGQSMIGDETGSHLQYKDVALPEFLAKQIINRINFKFTRSDFEPPDDYDKTITGIIADTARYYHFEKFSTARLHNLRLQKEFVFERNQLAQFGDDTDFSSPKIPSQGKLIHIRFDNGEVQLNEEQ
ncbi:MAG: hypothetical protein HY591_02595 [Candidatus Omnitrophica bacterium]|nr:hypothetical protein [Candidatus Omnitrophota bacterium]